MLSHIAVENYQSIKSASIELGRFTVVVGQTDSGKSAFTRAIKTLTSNTRGDSFITTGERLTLITATTDKGTVVLKRGSSNEYVLLPDSHPEQQQTFTKLNASTPTEVSAFLGIEAKDPINFAGQFDTPYLLKSTGTEVARILGELTNVDVIFRAAAESNKRRRNASTTLKTRSEDLASLMLTIEDYRPLQAQREAITKAQDALRRAAEADEAIKQLYALYIHIEETEYELAENEKLLAKHIPDITTIEKAQQQLTDFLTIVRDLTQAATDLKHSRAAEADAAEAVATAEQLYFDTLTAAGQCPTCSQDTSHLHPHS
jgi:DNA repair ATPase RecN